ncbi:hypothetical protein ACJRO7_026966 [Eucalyptus globulus]|uniref:TF-B3 domain-containing protein n=1 Tax=Eucalyptus globulus TaxID=34317 RepID=A0ABD3JTI9_EUCGL
MKSDPVSYVDDATTSHAIGLASGSKSKGFQTDQRAKLLQHDSEGVRILPISNACAFRIENSKCKVSLTMPASRSSKRSRVITALEAANKDELQYPSFTVTFYVLTHGSFADQKSTLWTVPGGVLKGCINGRMKTATLKYSNGSWPVKLLYHPQHGSGKLFASWGTFQRGTSLEEGDVCVFELVRTYKIESGAFQRGTSVEEGDVCVFELVRIGKIERGCISERNFSRGRRCLYSSLLELIRLNSKSPFSGGISRYRRKLWHVYRKISASLCFD